MWFSIEHASPPCRCPEGAQPDGEHRLYNLFDYWQPRFVIEINDLGKLLNICRLVKERRIILDEHAMWETRGSKIQTRGHIMLYDDYVE